MSTTVEKNPISTTNEWSPELLKKYDHEISIIAAEFNLDTYPNQIEIISAEQMMDAYSSSGMPMGYHHWSYGKQFLNVEKGYKRGQMGLAYELVINSNPCIAYLLEENTLTMQALVIAHASYGHNSFFKSNYLFKTWTSADAIVDYLLFSKDYISKCEERYSVEAVEAMLDACHALMNYGVDRYKKPAKLSIQEEKLRQTSREEYIQSQVNEIWRTLPQSSKENQENEEMRFPEAPEENILYFLEKNAPLLEPWQREIIRIVRKTSQYFYPQKQTKVMNEGWATFWHYTLLNTLYDRGKLSDKFMMEFLHNHTSVIYQPPYDSPYYSGINPYTLGLSMFQDLRRICESPTDEDRHWFPDLVDTNWVETIDFAMRNFKDESFIAQYLSPKVMRDLKLFCILDSDENMDYEVSYIHNEAGYQKVRELLSKQNNLSFAEPNIQVFNVDHKGDRSLTLQHVMSDRRKLGSEEAQEVLKHLHYIWGFDCHLHSIDDKGNIVSKLQCPMEKTGDRKE
ncbi:MAG: SpoVR family protein [Francisellaceae bacterium]|jgi:stage V sporulation protein R|nr:SpoVR family protein [Francisellaceae bacterium]MBT6539024.1 SpoVR family protein [Francisellaceae bacterium]